MVRLVRFYPVGKQPFAEMIKQARCSIIRGLKVQLQVYQVGKNASMKIGPWFTHTEDGKIYYMVKYLGVPLKSVRYDEATGLVTAEDMFLVPENRTFSACINQVIEEIRNGTWDYPIMIAKVQKQKEADIG